MQHIDGPFELQQNCTNTLEIVNKDLGEMLCQFYEDDDEVSELTQANANFVLKAVNEAWKKENKR